MFEAQIFENGHTRIFRTDDEGEFIKFSLDRLIQQYDIGASATVTPVGDGWYRVEVTFPQDCDHDLGGDLFSDLECAFSKRGKGWYECRKEGDNEDGTKFWWVVRHNHGPWI